MFQNVYHQIGCVDKENHKYRLITDLRQVNNYICDNNFIYEGINVVKEQIKFKDKLMTYDLKDDDVNSPRLLYLLGNSMERYLLYVGGATFRS